MPVPAAASATTAASKAGSAASKADVIGAVGEAAALALSTIGTISDANKRRKFEQNFQMLTAEQQKGLDRMLADSKSQTERLNILAQYLTQLNAQRISNLSAYYSDKERTNRNKVLLIVGGLLVLGVAATYFILRRKN